MLEMKEVTIIIYPKIAEDLFPRRKPKSQIIWRTPFKKWYEKPRIAKNVKIFIGKELIKEINNSKYLSPKVIQRRPSTKITNTKFNATPEIL